MTEVKLPLWLWSLRSVLRKFAGPDCPNEKSR